MFQGFTVRSPGCLRDGGAQLPARPRAVTRARPGAGPAPLGLGRWAGVPRVSPLSPTGSGGGAAAVSPGPGGLRVVFQALEEIVSLSHPELAAGLEGKEEQLLLCPKNDYKKMASDLGVCFLCMYTLRALDTRLEAMVLSSSASRVNEVLHDIFEFWSVKRVCTQDCSSPQVGGIAHSWVNGPQPSAIQAVCCGKGARFPWGSTRGSHQALLEYSGCRGCHIPCKRIGLGPLSQVCKGLLEQEPTKTLLKVLLDFTNSETTTVQKRVWGRIRNLSHGLADISKWEASKDTVFSTEKT
ncbi:uncharacterized protein LOC134564536 [Prinia subflava]|uniref:uncharacterized protein LOC134564536 n=1 Tax=Prinia subflava TaxID=208062 RepID=UPI002FE1E46E